MELQQQQQQVVQLEGLENGTAQNLLGKLINVLLTVMAVLLRVCVHCGELCRPLNENSKPHAFHAAPRNPPRLPLEALGCHLRVSASLSPAPQMTGWDRLIYMMKGQRVWGWCAHWPIQGVESQSSYLFFSFCKFSKHSAGLHQRFVTLSLFPRSFFWNRITGGMVGCLELTLWCSCDTGAYWKDEWVVVEGGAERTAHLISLFSVNLFTCGKLCIVSPRKKL